jgi:hypothetical protein
MKKDISAARLRKILRFDPDAGTFTWLVARRGCPIGSVAGKVHSISGYVRIDLDGLKIAAHRAAWLYMTGEWPERAIDHRDGDRANNRWSNLRVSDGYLNAQNIRAPMVTNSTGFLGVNRMKGRRDLPYRAKITANGRSVHLGFFGAPEEAHKAYLAAKRRLHQGCTI